MAVSEARERSYIRALMYLGRTPKLVRFKHAGHKTTDEAAQEIDSFNKWYDYQSKLNEYFIRHVFQGMTSALGNTDDWIEGFINWQREQHGEQECTDQHRTSSCR